MLNKLAEKIVIHWFQKVLQTSRIAEYGSYYLAMNEMRVEHIPQMGEVRREHPLLNS